MLDPLLMVEPSSGLLQRGRLCTANHATAVSRERTQDARHEFAISALRRAGRELVRSGPSCRSPRVHSFCGDREGNRQGRQRPDIRRGLKEIGIEPKPADEGCPACDGMGQFMDDKTAVADEDNVAAGQPAAELERPLAGADGQQLVPAAPLEDGALSWGEQGENRQCIHDPCPWDRRQPRFLSLIKACCVYRLFDCVSHIISRPNSKRKVKFFKLGITVALQNCQLPVFLNNIYARKI